MGKHSKAMTKSIMVMQLGRSPQKKKYDVLF